MEQSSNFFLQWWISPIWEGLLAALGPTNTQTLLALASFMNENGECYPSEFTLRKILGLRYQSSVSVRIKKLENAMWNNKPVIKIIRKRVKDEFGVYKWDNNFYQINTDIVSIFLISENAYTGIRQGKIASPVSAKPDNNDIQVSNDIQTRRPLRGEGYKKFVKAGKKLREKP